MALKLVAGTEVGQTMLEQAGMAGSAFSKESLDSFPGMTTFPALNAASEAEVIRWEGMEPI